MQATEGEDSGGPGLRSVILVLVALCPPTPLSTGPLHSYYLIIIMTIHVTITSATFAFQLRLSFTPPPLTLVPLGFPNSKGKLGELNPRHPPFSVGQ